MPEDVQVTAAGSTPYTAAAVVAWMSSPDANARRIASSLEAGMTVVFTNISSALADLLRQESLPAVERRLRARVDHEATVLVVENRVDEDLLGERVDARCAVAAQHVREAHLGVLRLDARRVEQHGGAVLAAQHADKAAPIASITKLMTAMVVLEAGQPLEEEITIGAEEVRATRGSASRIAPGTILTRGELLRLALMSSENRAAASLCHHYPGGLRPCIAAMNAKADALGMASTRYVEPTGLSPRNVSSPRDLSRLVLAAAENPVIAEYSTTPEYAVTLRRQRAEFHNTNPLVKSPAWDIALQKTGYIAEAGRCLVMRAVIDGRNVVIVLMNSWGTQTRFADARRIRAWLERRKPWNA